MNEVALAVVLNHLRAPTSLTTHARHDSHTMTRMTGIVPSQGLPMVCVGSVAYTHLTPPPK